MDTSSNADERPLTTTERAIASRWSELLGVEPILATDRFSDLGGESLLAEEMLLAIGRDLALRTDARLMEGDPTLAELGRRVEAARTERFRRGASTTVTLRSGERPGPAVFCFAGAGATALCFLELASHLPPSLAIHAFQARGLESRGLPDWSVGRAAERAVRAIGRLQPEGDLVLVGHSFGGHVAAEAGRRLLANGRALRRLVLLDSFISWDAGRSVGERAAGAGTSAPPRLEQIRTHLRVATVGLLRYPPAEHQALMWEQAIRVQNRMARTAPPDPTTVFVTDENAEQEPAWRSVLGDTSEVVRVPGNHNSVVNDSSVVRVVAEAIARDLPRHPPA